MKRFNPFLFTLSAVALGFALVGRKSSATTPPPPSGGNGSGNGDGPVTSPPPTQGEPVYLPTGFSDVFPQGVTGSAEGFIAAVPGEEARGAGDGYQWITETFPHDHGVNSPAPQWGEPTPQREARIFAGIQGGGANYGWAQVVLGPVDQTYAVVPVFCRALRVGSVESAVRVSTNFETCQHILDMCGAAMMTSKVFDATWLQAATQLPALELKEPAVLWSQDRTMAATSRMIQYSRLNDVRMLVKAGTALFSNEGKGWVNTKRFWDDPKKGINAPANPLKPGNEPKTMYAANYGVFVTTPTFHPVQSVGMAHNWEHVDYSQLVYGMGLWVLLQGKRSGLAHVGRVLADPTLSALLSSEGPLPSWKHPAFPVDWATVPELPGSVVL